MDTYHIDVETLQQALLDIKGTAERAYMHAMQLGYGARGKGKTTHPAASEKQVDLLIEGAGEISSFLSEVYAVLPSPVRDENQAPTAPVKPTAQATMLGEGGWKLDLTLCPKEEMHLGIVSVVPDPTMPEVLMVAIGEPHRPYLFSPEMARNIAGNLLMLADETDDRIADQIGG